MKKLERGRTVSFRGKGHYGTHHNESFHTLSSKKKKIQKRPKKSKRITSGFSSFGKRGATRWQRWNPARTERTVKRKGASHSPLRQHLHSRPSDVGNAALPVSLVRVLFLNMGGVFTTVRGKDLQPLSPLSPSLLDYLVQPACVPLQRSGSVLSKYSFTGGCLHLEREKRRSSKSSCLFTRHRD